MTVEQLILALSYYPPDMVVCIDKHVLTRDGFRFDYATRKVTVREGFYVGFEQPGVEDGIFVDEQRARSTNTSDGQTYLNFDSPHIVPALHLEGTQL